MLRFGRRALHIGEVFGFTIPLASSKKYKMSISEKLSWLFQLKKDPSVNLNPFFFKKKLVKSEGVGDIGNRILIVKQKHIKNIFLIKFLKSLPPKSNLGKLYRPQNLASEVLH